jgi:hypothetical protein
MSTSTTETESNTSLETVKPAPAPQQSQSQPTSSKNYPPVLKQLTLNQYFNASSSNSPSSSSSGMPALNGVSTVRDIKHLIQQGMIGRGPSKGDIESLASYLNELLNTMYLKEACEIVHFLWG